MEDEALFLVVNKSAILITYAAASTFLESVTTLSLTIDILLLLLLTSLGLISDITLLVNFWCTMVKQQRPSGPLTQVRPNFIYGKGVLRLRIVCENYSF